MTLDRVPPRRWLGELLHRARLLWPSLDSGGYYRCQTCSRAAFSRSRTGSLALLASGALADYASRASMKKMSNRG